MKMKNLLFNSLLILFIGISTSFLLHGDETPHGGVVVHANDGLYIEKLHGFKRLFFYLLENDERTTIRNKELKGVVEFILKDGTKEKHALMLANDNEALKIVFKEKKRIKTTIVHIRYKKKIITAQFK